MNWQNLALKGLYVLAIFTICLQIWQISGVFGEIFVKLTEEKPDCACECDGGVE